MGAREVEGLNLLRTKRSFPVYYVNPEHLVEVNGVKMYRYGFDVREDNFDFDSYDKFFSRNHYAPPIDSVADVRPNRQRKVPGIEIFAGGKLWNNSGKYYYMLVDNYGIDSNIISQYSQVVRRNGDVRAKISRFLESRLYSELKQSRRAYEKRMLGLINKYVSNPDNVFELRVLGETQAHRVPYNDIDLFDAIKNNVKIDIDWMLASGILGLFGAMSEKK